jgi:hypothetical protein
MVWAGATPALKPAVATATVLRLQRGGEFD